MSGIGIRHEDKYLMERRSPLSPSHIQKIIQDTNIKVEVQRSAKRIFSEVEYEKAGAAIVDNFGDEINTVLGVKEMPLDTFKKDKTYIFFSHVIKGQKYNMPMLKRMMEVGSNLIDYEKITDDSGKRLIFFGRFAGLAGAVNTLWTLGENLNSKGIENPFSVIKQSYRYSSLSEAITTIEEVGKSIKSNGLPAEINPLVIGITGYGNVSKGAQEILNLLPVEYITPENLISENYNLKKNMISVVIFKEEHLSKHNDPNFKFDLNHYYKNPGEYSNDFEKYIPKIDVLMNCMFWDTKYPRIITKDFLFTHFNEQKAKLKVIGDVTCDPDGSIECTHAGTYIEKPVYTYNPLKRDYSFGFKPEGVAIMAVDILPSELPMDSSMAFGDAILPFIEEVAKADFAVEFDKLQLPNELKRALILHKGKFTPDFEYLSKFVK